MSYSRKNLDGRSEDLYFWDGDIAAFNGAKIRVVELKGGLAGGYDPIDGTSVSMTRRKVF